MKYLPQFLIILGFTLLGEALQRIVPLPIPASVYGIVLLFLALCFRLVRPEQVKEAGGFLTSILPLLFVAPVVGLIDCWPLLQEILPALVVIVIVTTVLTFWVAGVVTKCLSRKKENNHA